MKRFALGFILIALASPASAQRSCESEVLVDEAHAQCERGALDATRHLAEGVPEWHWWGIPDHTTPVVDSLLREHGLRPVFHGDIVWEHEDHYTDAYNSAVHARLAPRLGDDFIAQAYAEAASLFPGLDALNMEVIRDVPVPPGACDGVARCLAFVSLIITPSGTPAELRIRHSPSKALDDPALAAAARLRFRPADNIEGGRVIDGYTFPVRFASQ